MPSDNTGLEAGLSPGAYRNAAGIWIDPADPAFNAEAIGGQSGHIEAPAENVIYLFSNARDGDGIAYAMAHDGTVIGSHWCSHWGYMKHDLHDRDDRQAACEKHYPDGYHLKVLGPGETPPAEVYERNQAKRKEAESV